MNDFKNIHYVIPGSEAETHRETAKQCKFGIVELGVLYGETSKILGEANADILVYGIDPIIPDSMNKKLIGNIDQIKNNTDHLKNFIFINDYSFNAVNDWDKNFDYIFIDASHRYDDVKKDFESWFLKLHSNGFVSLHRSEERRVGKECRSRWSPYH